MVVESHVRPYTVADEPVTVTLHACHAGRVSSDQQQHPLAVFSSNHGVDRTDALARSSASACRIHVAQRDDGRWEQLGL
jgi:hypothetical protein